MKRADRLVKAYNRKVKRYNRMRPGRGQYRLSGELVRLAAVHYTETGRELDRPVRGAR